MSTVLITSQQIDWAQAAQRETNVPASVTLAQYGIESAWGHAEPHGSNNPFGIKALPGQDAVEATTHEFVNGKEVTVVQRFRKFASEADAFAAHARLLATVPLYRPAIEAWLAGKLALGVQLMAQHYATDPSYASKVMAIITEMDLEKYDHLPAPSAPAPTTAGPQVQPAPVPNSQQGVPNTYADSPQVVPPPVPVKPVAVPIWLELLQGLLSLFAVKPRGK